MATLINLKYKTKEKNGKSEEKLETGWNFPLVALSPSRVISPQCENIFSWKFFLDRTFPNRYWFLLKVVSIFAAVSRHIPIHSSRTAEVMAKLLGVHPVLHWLWRRWQPHLQNFLHPPHNLTFVESQLHLQNFCETFGDVIKASFLPPLLPSWKVPWKSGRVLSSSGRSGIIDFRYLSASTALTHARARARTHASGPSRTISFI